MVLNVIDYKNYPKINLVLIQLTHGLPQHSDFNNYDFDFLAFGNFLPFGTDDQPNTPNRNNNVDSGLDRVATNDDKLKCFYVSFNSFL